MSMNLKKKLTAVFLMALFAIGGVSAVSAQPEQVCSRYVAVAGNRSLKPCTDPQTSTLSVSPDSQQEDGLISLVTGFFSSIFD